MRLGAACIALGRADSGYAGRGARCCEVRCCWVRWVWREVLRGALRCGLLGAAGVAPEMLEGACWRQGASGKQVSCGCVLRAQGQERGVPPWQCGEVMTEPWTKLVTCDLCNLDFTELVTGRINNNTSQP